MMREREARISSSWRLRSVTSIPDEQHERRLAQRDVGDRVAVQAITMLSPSALRHCVSRSALATPLAADAIAIRAR